MRKIYHPFVVCWISPESGKRWWKNQFGVMKKPYEWRQKMVDKWQFDQPSSVQLWQVMLSVWWMSLLIIINNRSLWCTSQVSENMSRGTPARGTTFPTRLYVWSANLWPACACWPPEDALDPCLPADCPATTLIRLRSFAGRSESSLGPHAVL